MTECGPCGKSFTSTTMFDKHRVGEHWPVLTRRCLVSHEMEAIGMVEVNGVWGIPLSNRADRERLEAYSRRRAAALTPREG